MAVLSRKEGKMIDRYHACAMTAGDRRCLGVSILWGSVAEIEPHHVFDSSHTMSLSVWHRPKLATSITNYLARVGFKLRAYILDV
jgi:hypothetical protein